MTQKSHGISGGRQKGWRLATAVKEQLRHSSIKITADVYGHLVPGANRQAVNRLPSLGGFEAQQRKGKQV